MFKSKPTKRLLFITASGFLVVAICVGIDLFRTSGRDFKDFDPEKVARRETAMWRAYYEGNRLRLTVEITRLLRDQYRLSWSQSIIISVRAARAAFVFKHGSSRTDYAGALPWLSQFFAMMQKASGSSFSPDRVAELELEWWIVRRDSASEQDLAFAVAKPAAELYGVCPDDLMEYGLQRVRAMRERSARALEGSLSNEDWDRIESMLYAAYKSAWQTIRETSKINKL